MGEYATIGRRQIKMGTCEDLYYLRATQAHQVTPERGSLNPRDPEVQKTIRFRFPWPDEDHVSPGEFEPFARCRELGLTLPVSAADLHETYATFVLAGLRPNSAETPCWRGTCDCLESYGTDPAHAGSRQRIMEHLELLTPDTETTS